MGVEITITRMNVSLNLNTEVTATLTPLGVEAMYKELTTHPSCAHTSSCELAQSLYRHDPETNTVRMPLWELMHVFGSRCIMGVDPLFKNNKITLDILRNSGIRVTYP